MGPRRPRDPGKEKIKPQKLKKPPVDYQTCQRTLSQENPCHGPHRGVPVRLFWAGKEALKVSGGLKDYQGNYIPVIGSGSFQVKFKEFVGLLQLTMVDGTLPSLLRIDSLGLAVT
ncbi:hypothetical protein E2320_001995, partial [Naja naja]